MKSSRPVGFIDSGIGGSTVLSESLALLPNENYVYFSDSANCPYGDKSDEAIIERCDEIISMLIEKYDCKAIVIACNTASAKASAFLRKKYALPIIAIEPAYFAMTSVLIVMIPRSVLILPFIIYSLQFYRFFPYIT